jgi:hypothetical protein
LTAICITDTTCDQVPNMANYISWNIKCCSTNLCNVIGNNNNNNNNNNGLSCYQGNDNINQLVQCSGSCIVSFKINKR